MFLGHDKDMVNNRWKDSHDNSLLYIEACVVNEDDIIIDIMWLLGFRGAF